MLENGWLLNIEYMKNNRCNTFVYIHRTIITIITSTFVRETCQIGCAKNINSKKNSQPTAVKL